MAKDDVVAVRKMQKPVGCGIAVVFVGLGVVDIDKFAVRGRESSGPERIQHFLILVVLRHQRTDEYLIRAPLTRESTSTAGSLLSMFQNCLSDVEHTLIPLTCHVQVSGPLHELGDL